MTKPGVLLVFSGPSGAGKDTILHSLLKNTKQVHCLSLPQPAARVRGKKTGRIIILSQGNNLKP